MATNRQFSLTTQTLSELKTDTSTSPATNIQRAAIPTLGEVLAKVESIPADALLLGIAADGLPVLLNLYDPHPGPLLIAADPSSGKTAFLQTIAHSLAATHNASDVQFGIVTNYPDEWENVKELPHQAGVFAVGHASAQQFIRSLAAWAHANGNTRQCTLLLVDDLESVASLDLQTVRDFRWLLLRGPARRVWPIVTLTAPRYGQVISWLQNFRTRFFGRIANGRVAEALGGKQAASLSQLEAGVQFSLPEGDKWLRFWLPRC